MTVLSLLTDIPLDLLQSICVSTLFVVELFCLSVPYCSSGFVMRGNFADDIQVYHDADTVYFV